MCTLHSFKRQRDLLSRTAAYVNVRAETVLHVCICAQFEAASLRGKNCHEGIKRIYLAVF